MRATVKAGHRRLAAQTESVLRQLGYKFIVNGGGDVIEFELQSPCRCIVSVRDASGPTMRIPLIVSARILSVIDIRRMLGSEQDPITLAATAAAIAEALSAQVPKLKWKGGDEFDSGIG